MVITLIKMLFLWYNIFMKIRSTKKQINLYKKFGIDIIYLFGSQASGYTTPLSDIDIGIVFREPQKYRENTLAAHDKLFKELIKFFSSDMEVDLVFLQFTPIRLQARAILEGRVLYEGSKIRRIMYEENVMKIHADLVYFMNLRYEAILRSI